MNVPAHLILGAAVLARPGRRAVSVAAVLGSFAPDLSLFVMAGWSLYVRGTDPAEVFGRAYFSDSWQQVFAVDNSFLLWGAALALALWRRWPVPAVFAAAGLIHLGFDFVLHNEDARMMFWPLSDWVFRSPFSYWDPRHYGRIIGPLELAMTWGLAVLLWRRFEGVGARAMIVAAALAELLTGGVFGMLFDH